MIFNSSYKKVLLVTSWPFPHLGGVSSHIQLLASRLNIHESEVVNFRHIYEESIPLTNRLLKALERYSRKLLKMETISIYSKTLSFILAKKEFEIVHCHDAMATWAAIRARNATRKNFKIISTVHGPVSLHMMEDGYLPDSSDVKKVIKCEKEAWKESDAIICVDSGQTEIVKSQGADLQKIIIIPNAVDIDKINNYAKAFPITKKDNCNWILVPRRLSPKNGVEYAIRALSLIEHKPKLLLAGTGLERKSLEELVKQLGLQDDVVFLGGLEHSVLLPIMLAADIIAIPSVPVYGIEEATSIAAIEAMALGKPVISSNIGGLKLLITDDVNGILVPPADPDRLAECITKLLLDKQKCVNLGIVARKTVEEKFSVDLWFDKHKRVYSKVLKDMR